MKQSKEYQAVTITKDLLEDVKRIIDDRRVHFRSVSEFVHAAIREKIETYLALYPDLKDSV
ncbi:MAG: hypothetical protein ACTSRR_09705 [Candidatus Heimdallarchaeaceae archaeon]